MSLSAIVPVKSTSGGRLVANEKHGPGWYDVGEALAALEDAGALKGHVTLQCWKGSKGGVRGVRILFTSLTDSFDPKGVRRVVNHAIDAPVYGGRSVPGELYAGLLEALRIWERTKEGA